MGFWMVSVCFGSICSWGWSKTTNSGGTTLRCDLGIFSEAMFRWFLLLRSRSMELTQGSCLQFYNNHVISLCEGLRSINTHHPPFMGGNSGTPLADPFSGHAWYVQNHPIQGHMLHYFHLMSILERPCEDRFPSLELCEHSIQKLAII